MSDDKKPQKDMEVHVDKIRDAILRFPSQDVHAMVEFISAYPITLLGHVEGKLGAGELLGPKETQIALGYLSFSRTVVNELWNELKRMGAVQPKRTIITGE